MGLGTSANYPLLFSYIGAYYYVMVGQVQDAFLKIVAPTMWLLSVLTTFLIGRKLGGFLTSMRDDKGELGRSVGSISAILILAVPSFIEYAYQTIDETTETFFLALGSLFLIHSLDNTSRRGYFIATGIAFGAACLTSYQGLYFVIPLIVIVGAKSLRRGIVSLGSDFTGNALIMLSFLMLIGAAPYVRNLIILHNPIDGVRNSERLNRSAFNCTQLLLA